MSAPTEVRHMETTAGLRAPCRPLPSPSRKSGTEDRRALPPIQSHSGGAPPSFEEAHPAGEYDPKARSADPADRHARLVHASALSLRALGLYQPARPDVCFDVSGRMWRLITSSAHMADFRLSERSISPSRSAASTRRTLPRGARRKLERRSRAFAARTRPPRARSSRVSTCAGLPFFNCQTARTSSASVRKRRPSAVGMLWITALPRSSFH